MKVELSKVTSLFLAIGVKSAGSWTAERAKEKVAKLSSMVDKETAEKLAEDRDNTKTLKAILKAQKAEEEVEVVEDEEKPAKAAKTDAKEGKAAKRAGETGKEKRARNVGQGPGVISVIAEVVGEATEKKPVTRADILAVLTERFPSRDADAMNRTIGIQVPSRLKKEKEMDVRDNGLRGDERAYFTVPAGTPAAAKEKPAAEKKGGRAKKEAVEA